MPEPDADINAWPPPPVTGHPLSEYDGELSGMMAELSAARVPPSLSLLAQGLHERERLGMKAAIARVRSFSARQCPGLIAEEKRILRALVWVFAAFVLNIAFVFPLSFWSSDPSHLRLGPVHFSPGQRVGFHGGLWAAEVGLVLAEVAAVLYASHISRRYSRRVRRFRW